LRESRQRLELENGLALPLGSIPEDAALEHGRLEPHSAREPLAVVDVVEHRARESVVGRELLAHGRHRAGCARETTDGELALLGEFRLDDLGFALAVEIAVVEQGRLVERGVILVVEPCVQRDVVAVAVSIEVDGGETAPPAAMGRETGALRALDERATSVAPQARRAPLAHDQEIALPVRVDVRE
jgi:hypothetical protein